MTWIGAALCGTARARQYGNMSKARILVADDDVALLDVISEVLEQRGAQVMRARSGAELIESIGEQGPFDLVITDVSMPWMSGLQAMHSARTAGMSTPVIVITALNDEQLAAQVQLLGHDAVLLRKPFTIDTLWTTAAELLTARPRHQPDHA
jgi:CheY-like chemotaxis protein